ncbi:MAG: hypothetical protein Q7R65_01205 [bacterium]|nr:hypothetical protein [bacterium]
MEHPVLPKNNQKFYYGVKSFSTNATGFFRLDKFERYYTAAIVVLVGLSSFGLGRLSIMDERREPIIVEGNVKNSEITPPAVSAGGAVTQTATVSKSLGVGELSAGKLVASKNGTKYYFPWCASNIAEKNKIWFNSETEARAKGYQPAANCKGLK